MSYCTANGLPVSEARITVPRIGVWVATLELEEDGELLDRTELVLGGVRFVGTVRRSGLRDGGRRIQLVGGAGGLRTQVAAQGYRNVPVSLVLSDILKQAGEKLSTTCNRTLLATVLPHWGVVRSPAGQALGHVLQHVGASWRVLLDGTLWLGVESWPFASVEHEVEDEDPLADGVTIVADSPTLAPGQTFLGRGVGYVEHTLTADSVRTKVFFE